MYTLEEHNNTKNGISIDIRDKTRLSELITHLYNLGFRYYLSQDTRSLSELISEFNTKDYLILPNYYNNNKLQLHPRSNNEDIYETRTIDEMLKPESKYYSYYNVSNKYTVIFKGIVTEKKAIISDKDFKHFIIIEKNSYCRIGIYLYESSYSNLKELSPTSDEALWLNACADADEYLRKISISQVKVGDYVYVSVPDLGGKIGKIHFINNATFPFESAPELKLQVCTDSFVRRCSQKEIDEIDKSTIKNLPTGYVCFKYEEGEVYADISYYENNGDANCHWIINAIDDYIDETDTFYHGYLSVTPMSQDRIEWFDECINEGRILDFPLKNDTQISCKDYVENEYYYSKFKGDDDKWNEIIFKFNRDYSKNAFIQITCQRFFYGVCCNNDRFSTGDIRRLATEQEVEWLEACIKADKFLELKDIGKNNNVKLTNGYYHIKHKDIPNCEYIIKIVDDYYYYLQIKSTLFYGEIKFKMDDYTFIGYTITPASTEDASWLADCISLGKLVNRPTSNDVSIPKSKITSQFIKSDVDDLITMPQLEIKKTKITFINN